MGVKLKDLVEPKEIEIKDLKGKVIVIDAYNMLYQFLSSIRSRDGELLTDSKGNTTSHLIGLFSRVTTFLENEITPIFIFDGQAPKLKEKERERRRLLKEAAAAKYHIAVEENDVDGMKKYASRTTKLTQQMITDAKTLLDALGITCITAPSEGEAQAAEIVKQAKAYAAVSQDFDSLLFGCPILIRNLSIAGRRKKIHGVGTTTIKPEMITLSKVLNELQIDQDGLVALGMLVGTDFNVGGIKGIGPKKALKLVQKYKGNYELLFQEIKWNDYFDVDWTEVFYLFKKMRVDANIDIQERELNTDRVAQFLVDEREFSHDRVQASLDKLKKVEKLKEQKGLGDFM